MSFQSNVNCFYDLSIFIQILRIFGSYSIFKFKKKVNQNENQPYLYPDHWLYPVRLYP
jgi:hypothetical protein